MECWHRCTLFRKKNIGNWHLNHINSQCDAVARYITDTLQWCDTLMATTGYSTLCMTSLVICPEKRDGTFYRCISNLFNWLTPIPGTFPIQPSLYQVNIGWGSGLVLPGNKPSLLPLVIKIFVAICRHCTTLGYAIITVYCNDYFLVCTERCLRYTCLFDCTCLSFSITNCYMLVIMIYQYLANI